ncbi:MAG TPA: NAD-dependent epimerase/dehydratase family protein [Acidimicrobiia bacterium]
MRVLVTGGAGFIGSHLAARLNRRHSVAIIDDLSGGYRRNVPDGVRFYGFDLTDHRNVDKVFALERPELVVHCAAYAAEGLSHWMRRYCFTQNLISWANLANAAVDAGTHKIVVCSSMAVYGSQAPPFTEDLAPHPEDPYGAAKAAMEADLWALAAVHGIDVGVIRPHNVYGPRQNLADPYRNVVAIFMRQALAGDPITVHGSGEQVRAFSYIDDVAAAIVSLTEIDDIGTVNVGGETPITINHLAELVKEATGSDSPIVHLPERHEVDVAYCDHDRLRQLLGGWDPTPIELGLERMAEWARSIQIGPLRSYEYETTRNLFAPWQR